MHSSRMFSLLLLSCSVVLVATYPANDYEYSLKRNEFVEAESSWVPAKFTLTDEEKVVDRYLRYLKHEEFNRTRRIFLPSRPIEEVMDEIINTKLFRVLKTMPKGGNMHSHENHVLSKKILLDIVFASEDFPYLYILPENHTSSPWTLDFFTRPPQGEGWINVKNSSYYTKERIYPHQVLMGIMDNYTRRYPTDSGERWRQMNKLWGRGSSQLIANRKIKAQYIWEMLRTGYEEGVLYHETRKNFGGLGMYVLDPNYSENNGKRPIDPERDVEIQLTKDIIANFTSVYPNFIDMRRITYSQRQQPFSTIEEDAYRAVKLHEKYPDHILGYDLVGEEDAGNSHLYYSDILLKLYDSNTGKSRIPLYFHVIETSWPHDLKTSMNQQDDPLGTMHNVFDTMVLDTKRMGHALGAIKNPSVVDWLYKNQIPVETCPVSNQILCLVPDIRNHPALSLYRRGIPVILGSDDPGTFGYDHFTIDWYHIFMGWGLTLMDLKTISYNSLNYSSLALVPNHLTDATTKWINQWNKYIHNMSSEACSVKLDIYEPNVYRVFPRTGARDATTVVSIFGHHFERAVCRGIKCRFGGLESPNAHYVDDDHVQCEAPVPTVTSSDSVVNISISLDGGATYMNTGLNFTYRHTAPPAPSTAAPTIAPVSAGVALVNEITSLLLLLSSLYCYIL